ncbi:MAG: RsmE family RNA methyltransferase [Phycisphaerae bacterium]
MTPSRPPRFFVPPTAGAVPALRAGADVALPASEAHHAAHVLRLGPGEGVELFDGRGAVAAARIADVARGGVTATVESVRTAGPEPAPALRLAFAVPKGKRLEWLLEKATELGAARLAPVRFARSVAGGEALSPTARGRWEARCIAAAKQAGRAHLPVIEPVRPLAEALPAGEPALVGDAGAAARPVARVLAALPRGPCPQTLHLYVGPEGGLTDAERALLADAGATAVRLGRTVLRVETAAAALLAVSAAWRDGAAGPGVAEQ